MVVLANQLVQLVVHVTADGSTVLFDLGDVSYRVIDIAVSGVVAVGYRIDQMGACIGSTAAWGGRQKNSTGGFYKALRGAQRVLSTSTPVESEVYLEHTTKRRE